MKNLITIFFVLLSFSFSCIHAQSFFDKFSTGVNFEIKSPEGELRQNGLTDFYGISLELFYVGCTDKKFRFTPGYRFLGGITKQLAGERISLAEPLGAEATEKIFNAYFGFELVGRFMYDNGNRIRPYVELHAGPRFTSGYELLDLTQPVNGYSNSSEVFFTDSSLAAGISLGLLVQLNEDIDLNLKAGIEYTGTTSHSDLSQSAAYSLERLETANAFNQNFSIGINIRPRCGRAKRVRRNNQRHCAPSGYNSCSTTPIQRVKK